MRRGRRDRDAGLADLEPADPVVQRQPHARPAARRFRRRSARTPSAPAARTPRTPDIGRAGRRCGCAPARETSRRRRPTRPAARPRADGRDQRLERQRRRSDRQQRSGHLVQYTRGPVVAGHTIGAAVGSPATGARSRNDPAGRGRGRWPARGGWRRRRRPARARSPRRANGRAPGGRRWPTRTCSRCRGCCASAIRWRAQLGEAVAVEQQVDDVVARAVAALDDDRRCAQP